MLKEWKLLDIQRRSRVIILIKIAPFVLQLAEMLFERYRVWRGIEVDENESLWSNVRVHLEETLFDKQNPMSLWTRSL